ncbi:hypothetical protein O0L34_g9336 [Tuta absoluta]|nr:hypothetical protein O0L34_g9336 [Tuta absoluta]
MYVMYVRNNVCVAHKEAEDNTYAAQLDRKEKAFQHRDDDKAAAQKDSKILAFNFDLESVLSTPKGAAGPFFYVRKLAVYNLTIYNLGNQDVECFLWDETEGKRGSTEIGTCVYQYINSKPDITHVRMMSDNCGGQQNNVGFCCMLMYLVVNHPTLETIDHAYFESGHSHMECDYIHSKIEQKSKNTPDGWAQLIRMARRNPSPFKVYTVMHDEFLNFNTSQFQLSADLPKKPKQPRKKKPIEKPKRQ